LRLRGCAAVLDLRRAGAFFAGVFGELVSVVAMSLSLMVARGLRDG
jgi:hypothetical protein